jgi:hypothetical protein
MDQAFLLQDPKVKLFLARVKREVLDDTVHKKITDDLLNKINIRADELEAAGSSTEDAVKQAVADQGRASTIGKKYNKTFKLSYFNSHYVNRFLYNCVGLIIVAIFLIVFNSNIQIPFAYMLLIVSVTAGLSAWITFKRFLRPIYFVLNIFAVPVYLIYTVLYNIYYRFKAYKGIFTFRDPTYPFMIDFSVYSLQVTTALVLAATGILVTLWLYSGAFMKARKTAYIRSAIAILMAIVLFATIGFHTKNNQFMQGESKLSLVNYWTGIKASQNIAQNFATTAEKKDFTVSNSLEDMGRIANGYIATYGKPVDYHVDKSLSALSGYFIGEFKSVQAFLYATPVKLELLKDFAPKIPDSVREEMVGRFFDKILADRQSVADLSQENFQGLFIILSGIDKAYSEMIDEIKAY